MERLAFRFKQLSVNDIFAEVIRNNRKKIINLNTSRIEVGKTIKGSLIKPDYANKNYLKNPLKLGKKSPGMTPDLKLTGNFYRDFDTDILPDGKSFYITSFDEKAPSLEAKYRDIYGLTDEDVNKLNIREEIYKKLKEKL